MTNEEFKQRILNLYIELIEKHKDDKVALKEIDILYTASRPDLILILTARSTRYGLLFGRVTSTIPRRWRISLRAL